MQEGKKRKTYWLKQHVFIISVSVSQECRWITFPGFPKAAFKMSAGLCSFLELRVPIHVHIVVGRIQLLVAVGLRSLFSGWLSALASQVLQSVHRSLLSAPLHRFFSYLESLFLQDEHRLF